MAIRDWADGEGPREKLVRHGAATLSDAELVAILLRTGAGRGRSAVDVARELLAECGGLRYLGRLTPDHLCRIDGIGATKATTVLAMEELARRWALPPSADAPHIGSSREVFVRYGPRLCRKTREELLVVAVNVRHAIVREAVVAQGDACGAAVLPRAVFAPAMTTSAAAILVVHNHPSGDPSPSLADREATLLLARIGALLGIPLLDHLIIGDGIYFSFRDAGALG